MVCDIANQALLKKNDIKYNSARQKCISYPVMEGKYSLTLKVNGNYVSNPILLTGKRISVKFVEAMVRFITENDSTSKQLQFNAFRCCKLKLEMMESGMIGVLSIGMVTTNRTQPEY